MKEKESLQSTPKTTSLPSASASPGVLSQLVAPGVVGSDVMVQHHHQEQCHTQDVDKHRQLHVGDHPGNVRQKLSIVVDWGVVPVFPGLQISQRLRWQ